MEEADEVEVAGEEVVVGEEEAGKTIESALKKLRKTMSDWRDIIMLFWVYQRRRNLNSGGH